MISANTFHPFELAICGYSGSGKTTLLSKVIPRLSHKYSLTYLKHDVHNFEMDKKGKDTERAWSGGAHQVYISDPRHSALITRGGLSVLRQKTAFLDSDFILLEGYKNTAIPKIVFIDENKEILKAVFLGEIKNIVAFVGPEHKNPVSASEPYFQRDEIDSITNFIEEYFLEKTKATPLYGLVLAGGQSSRMKQDKALLQYHGRTQIEESCELLGEFCQKVFISSRSDQNRAAFLKNYSHITDLFIEVGPLGGILSAMKMHPQAAWFVLACDLPFVDVTTIMNLLRQRNPFKMASCYTSTRDRMPEPLCAIYEPKIYSSLLGHLGLGHQCPRKSLLNLPVHNIELESARALENINYPEEFIKAKEYFNRGVSHD